MEEKYIMFNTPSDINRFVNRTESSKEELSLSAGEYCVDAKSVISVMTLGVGRPIKATYAKSEYMDELLKEFFVDVAKMSKVG